METPKIYVVNLNSYNNGRTRGEWYELPVDFSRIKSDLLLDVEHGKNMQYMTLKIFMVIK